MAKHQLLLHQCIFIFHTCIMNYRHCLCICRVLILQHHNLNHLCRYRILRRMWCTLKWMFSQFAIIHPEFPLEHIILKLGYRNFESIRNLIQYQGLTLYYNKVYMILEICIHFYRQQIIFYLRFFFLIHKEHSFQYFYQIRHLRIASLNLRILHWMGDTGAHYHFNIIKMLHK